MKNNSFTGFILISIFLVIGLTVVPVYAQNTQDWIKYNKQSNFIKEFDLPIKEFGLKGITTDPNGNVWAFHSTNNSTTIIKLDPDSEKFTLYDTGGITVAPNSIQNLAGGMLIFDKERNAVWFTDSRTNSIGKLDVQSGKVDLVKIPTAEAGPMGIVLSPDGKSVWFAEIFQNKIGRLDVTTRQILEYPTGDQTGPSFLSFDNAGALWVTLSYAHAILRIDTTELVPNTQTGMSVLALPELDLFSPFGIGVLTNQGGQEIFVTDHGSSRLLVLSYINSHLQEDVTYWTSTSQISPQTLPGQIVTDKDGNIYFPEHIGNRIAKINLQTGEMTEYDIPTGPLSTVLYIAPSYDGKIWFNEVVANKIAYLDTTIPVPFDMRIESGEVYLDKSGPKTIGVLVTAKNNSKSVSLDEVDMNVTGMTDSGLKGVSYSIEPQKIDTSKTSAYESKVTLNAEDDAKPGQYTIMVTASAFEKDGLVVSQLYPVQLTLNVSVSKPVKTTETGRESGYLTDLSFPNIIRFVLISVVVILIAYLIYRRIKSKPR